MRRIPKLDMESTIDLSPLDRFVGMSCEEIDSTLELGVNLKGKSFARLVTEKMLSKSGVDFNPERYALKMIRVNSSGMPMNPTSLKVEDYEALMEEDWDSSQLKGLLGLTYVFFVVTHGSPQESFFKGYVLHRFSPSDIESARTVWSDTQSKILAGDYDHFLTDKDTGTFFFKIHASNTYNKVRTSNGGMQVPRSFWISRALISKIVIDV